MRKTEGLFELAGIPAELVKAFSKRSRELDASASADDRDQQQRRSRQAKGEPTDILRRQAWKDEVTALGYDADIIVQSAVGRRVAEHPLPDWTMVAEEITAKDSCPRVRDARRKITEHLVGFNIDKSSLVEIQRQVISERFIDLGFDTSREAICTTQAVLRAERRIVDIAPKIAARSAHALHPSQLEQALFYADCDHEQVLAFRAATSGRDLTVIEGAAGTGKSRTIGMVVEAYKAAGYQTLVTAPSWVATKGLGEAVGSDYSVLPELLNDLRGNKRWLPPTSVVIVDEAGMVGARSMASLLTEVESFGAKVILIGDRHQLQPVEAGPALSLALERLPHESYATLSTVRRQRSASDREQTLRWRAADPDAAFEAINFARAQGTWRSVKSEEQAADSAVDLWASFQAADEEVLILARTHAELRAITDRIRKKLRDSGQIVGEDAIILAADRQGNLFDLPIARGDQVRIGKRVRKKGLINGSGGTIQEISTTQDGVVEIKLLVDGRIVSVTSEELRDPESGGLKIRHGYASTTHAAQGVTVKNTIVVAGTVPTGGAPI
ncbi:ATP-dependent DNA helicase [Oleomonas cavernae]|uniref:ATP-dependent DNA helicase n=1 Tax=Oleomonas cavernae TaxID=2320859 RepID=UPI0011C3D0AE|nr:AAA family ATPase [Oleomonas cavernae]